MHIRRLRLAVVFSLLFLGCGDDAPDAPPPAVDGQSSVTEPAPAGEPWFVDEAAARGVTLLNRTGRPGRKEFIMSAVGPGAAVFDADGDGRLDIYIPNGNQLIGPNRDRFYEEEDRPRNALYIQQDDGTFRDEAKARGVDDDAWGFGACAADLDNDGDQDLVVANLGPNRLYVNDGRGHFTDIAVAAGVAGPADRGRWEWSTCFACGDYDRDGRVDLYLGNYADMFAWMRTYSRIERNPDGSIANAAVCDWQRLKVYCGPLGIPTQQDRLFRNAGGADGALRFEDVTVKTRIFRPDEEGGAQYAFQAIFTDLNRDGRIDIYVANDSVPSFFFEAQADGTFKEVGRAYGIALSSLGEDMAGMGADIGDVDGDGWMDVIKTNFSLQTNNLYIAEPFQGRVTYRDFSIRTGIEKEVYTDLGWGALLFDYDNDGDPDIFFANGHVYPEVDLPEARGLNTSFDQYNKLLRNETREGRLRFVPEADAGPGFAIRKGSRGASFLDFDNDGDLDLLVINLNNTPDLLVNRRGSRAGHWVQLALVGNVAKGSNRDALGSRLKVTAGDHVQWIETRRGRGFLGCCDPRVHVGLGARTGPVEVAITWPNGDTSTHVLPDVDRAYRIEQK